MFAPTSTSKRTPIDTNLTNFYFSDLSSRRAYILRRTGPTFHRCSLKPRRAMFDVLLEVALDMGEDDLASYEWSEEGKPYREWLIPAAIVNARATVRIVEDEDGLPSRFQLD